MVPKSIVIKHMFWDVPLSLMIMTMPLILSADSWAETTLNTLSRAEKIGQLIAARINSNADFAVLEHAITDYRVGGIMPLHYWAIDHYRNFLQAIKTLQTKIPPLIMLDAEWGCAMRIPELPAFPKAMTLGAIPSEQSDLVYAIGYAIGMQCRALGIHINCAPVFDINSNLNNPVIGMRSFGDNTDTVIPTAFQYACGMWDSGVLPCLKHFPGHGDTTQDSHVHLPIITASYNNLWRTDIAPYQALCHTMPLAIMIGHMAVPALEAENAIIPASLSETIIRTTLMQQLNFDGLIISDALDMGALDAYGDPGEIALQALQAGVDLLLCPSDIEAVIARISCALETGEYSEAALDAHVLKVLQTKEQLGLHEKKIVPLPPLTLYEDLIQQAYDNAVSIIPRDSTIGNHKDLKVYKRVTLGKPNKQLYPQYEKSEEQNPLLVYLYPGNYKTHRLTDVLRKTVQEIAEQRPESIVLLSGSPYCLMDIPEALPTLVLYEDVPYTHVTAQKVLDGELIPHGKLPVTIKK